MTACELCNVERATMTVLDVFADVTVMVCQHCRADLERTVHIRVLSLVPQRYIPPGRYGQGR